jgi:serine/threonine protein kinase
MAWAGRRGPASKTVRARLWGPSAVQGGEGPRELTGLVVVFGGAQVESSLGLTVWPAQPKMPAARGLSGAIPVESRGRGWVPTCARGEARSQVARTSTSVTGSQDIATGVRPGDLLVGKYRVERVLGQGGMGVVVAAHHIQLDEKVALKFLLPEGLKNPEAVARFIREARAAVKIKSEHVARVSDVGQLENGSPYMVMEYLDGRDLAAWLKQRGAMSVEMAVDFVLQAIAEAHAVGIVHRDLKPANLFCVLRADGQLSVKVLDFGISKVTTPGTHGHDMTNTAAIVGSPMYMSPEQLQSSKGVDTRTDIWSLGVILFELLTVRVPFQAEAVTELVIKIATAPALPVRLVRPDVPAGLEQVIATCLEKDRERRFASVSELAIALKDFGSRNARVSVERILGTLRTAGISAAMLPPSGEFKSATSTTGSPPAPMPQTMATWGRTGASVRPRGARPVVWIGTAIVLGVVAMGGVLFLKRSSTLGATTTAVASGSAGASSSAVQPVVTAAEAVTLPEVVATNLPTASTPTASQTFKPASPPARLAGGANPSPPVVARPAPAPQPASKPAPNCDPPYTLDDQGRKHFKAECYK